MRENARKKKKILTLMACFTGATPYTYSHVFPFFVPNNIMT